MFSNKTIFISGGTGSFGKAFTKYLLLNFKKIKKIIIFSRDEFKQSLMKDEFAKFKTSKLRFFLGDVRDKERLMTATQDVNYIIHAAALKHVPIAEYNPLEFIKTNILGAQNIIECSLKNNVSKVIALSTDKASSPINLYGATKLCSDKLFVSANNIVGKNITKFSVVRYGNVFGSRGSVIPLFLNSKNFFKVTDTRMTRFNISLEHGVKSVRWAFKNLNGGEILVPKIPSYKILDVCKSINPRAKIKNIGIRPGEKIHEQMISKSDSDQTVEVDKFYLIYPASIKKQKKRFFYNNFSGDKTFLSFKSKKVKKVKKDFRYSSKDNFFMSVAEIKKLIDKHKKEND